MSSFCFATMAVGSEYVSLARLLIGDIYALMPNTPVFVLTDNKKAFVDFENVICVEFRRTGFWYIYHEKRQVIEQAMSLYDICLFLDADCRLFAPPPIREFIALAPGVYGAYLQSFSGKFNSELQEYSGSERPFKNTPKRRARLLEQVCEQFNLTFDDLHFVQEAALLFVAGPARMGSFFHVWEYIGHYLSTNLFEWGEGFTIGMAGNYCRISIGAIPSLQGWLFKDLLTPASLIQPVHNDTYKQFTAERSALAINAKNTSLRKVKKHSVALLRLVCFLPLWHLYKRRQLKSSFILG